MESKIAVVHYSEIVRKGLVSVLNPIWKGDIIQSRDIHSFLKIGYCQRCRMLVFIEAEQLNQVAIPNENSTFVAFFDTEKQIESSYSKWNAVSLRSEYTHFQNIVAEFGQKNTSGTIDEHELTLR